MLKDKAGIPRMQLLIVSIFSIFFVSSSFSINQQPKLRTKLYMQEPRSILREQQNRIATTASSMVTLSVLLFPKSSSATLQSVDGRISEVETKKKKKSDSEVLVSIENLDIAAAFIVDHCTQILSAVKNSGRCLYRGESSCGISPVLLSPDFDLLDPSTYASSVASDYFSTLDTTMVEQGINSVHPSIGHIGTSNAMKAGEWGPVCSVWPVDALHYAFFSAGEKELWDDEWRTPQCSRGPFFWRDKEKLSQFLTTDVKLTVDVGLEGALSSGREVLFTSKFSDKYTFTSKDKDLPVSIKKSLKKKVTYNVKKDATMYLAIPLLLEAKLLELLGVTPFDPTANENMSVTKPPTMQVDDVRRKKNYLTSSNRIVDQPPSKEDFLKSLNKR
mmetsp:Transcript_15840/g.15210  ORF Transcript_15840/g.15210 Transcript_15840/m.15210 type:complete len:388 (-) Transcript_15840:391-1554(-)